MQRKAIAQRRAAGSKNNSKSNCVREFQSITDVILLIVVLVICVLTITKGYDAQLAYGQSSANDTDVSSGSEEYGGGILQPDGDGVSTTGSGGSTGQQISCPDSLHLPEDAVCRYADQSTTGPPTCREDERLESVSGVDDVFYCWKSSSPINEPPPVPPTSGPLTDVIPPEIRDVAGRFISSVVGPSNDDMLALFVLAAIIVIVGGGGIAIGKYIRNQRSSRRMKIPPGAVVEIKTKGGIGR